MSEELSLPTTKDLVPYPTELFALLQNPRAASNYYANYFLQKESYVFGVDVANGPAAEEAFSSHGRFWLQKILMLVGGRFSIREVRANHNIEAAKLLAADFNGDTIGRLADKYEFVELVRDLNYTAPNQAKFIVGDDIPTLDLKGQLILKPLGGSEGAGIKYAESTAELTEVVQSAGIEVGTVLVAQELLPIHTDGRYILDRTRPGSPKRIAYEKIVPTVTGDGFSTTAQLVESANIPARAKDTILKTLSNAELEVIPTSGQVQEIVNSGNISQGAYSSQIEGTRLANLDRFMLELVAEIEAHCSHELVLGCFDLGFLSEDALNGEYDFARIKEQVALIEFQFPFEAVGYWDNMLLQRVHEQIYRLANFKRTQNGRST